ncbi:DEKNAAC101936 [Brettanomyces naardenensis]|uniref:DEKNAAC101936 n=1 Tax=Brettanomyces naardenensis TaxID=13370 RepID=A0A448YJF8_BRENA|nr:DEKNAAC101936 [Brettanomyces naardenensis]
MPQLSVHLGARLSPLHSIDEKLTEVPDSALPPLKETDTEAEAEADDEKEEKERQPMKAREVNDERKQLQKLINETGFMMLDEEMPVDTETQRNTLQNALMYQLSEDELRQIDPKYVSDSEAERLLMSPELSPTLADTAESLPIFPLSPTASTDENVSNLSNVSRENSFRKGVTLDTFTTADADLSKYQITLTSKHRDYRYTKTARTLICTYDEKQMSLSALQWTLKEMVSDSDTLVVFSVLDPADLGLVGSSSQNHRKKANDLLERVISLNERGQKIKVVLEFKVGNVQYMVNKAIRDYDPSFLIVGTDGNEKTGFRSLIAPKSMSKCFLEYAKVPVIVVNPLYNTSENEFKGGPFNDRSFIDQMLSCPSVYQGLEEVLSEDSGDSLSPISSLESLGRKSRFFRFGSPLSASVSPTRTISPLRFLRRKN